MKKFDIIIIGAGAAGSIAAYFGAKRGYNVCLIDGKPQEKIGDKICGDGIGGYIFDFLGIPHPKKGEYLNTIDGAKIYPPDTRYPIILKGSSKVGYIIDRLPFGQRLMEDAVQAGAHLYAQTRARTLIYDKNLVVGVVIKSKIFKETELYANVVIDASGFHTQLRKQVDIPFLSKDIDPNDYIVCYREILRMKNPVVFDKKYLSIYADHMRAPGGYIWYFPRNEYEVNLGFGMPEKYKRQLIEYYRNYLYERYIGDEPCTKINGGSGLVSICKPLWTGVGNGILFVGDAAWQVNPLTGGGLVSAMKAGLYAIKAYEKAVEVGKFDVQSLWEYNLLSQKSIGAEFAPLDLFRSVYQNFSDDILNYILKKRLITGEEIGVITTAGEISLSLGSILGKLFRGLSKPKVLLDLIYLRKQMQKVKILYLNYPPSPLNLGPWVEQVQKIYGNVRKRFGLSA